MNQLTHGDLRKVKILMDALFNIEALLTDPQEIILRPHCIIGGLKFDIPVDAAMKVLTERRASLVNDLRQTYGIDPVSTLAEAAEKAKPEPEC